MKFRLPLIFILALMVGGLPIVTFAISESSISMDVVPPNPNPYENVTITLSSFAANLDTVKIEWLADGKIGTSGIGKKSFSVTSKAANVETRVEARISLPDGQINKRVTIRPSVMVLLWEANDSYVPPFYRGKALPTLGNEIKVVAMPEIRIGSATVSPKNMTYSWKKDYSNQPNDSGYGKNFFTYTNDYLEDESVVGVTASTVDQKYETENSIRVGAFLPKILFYREDSLLGTIWGNTLKNNYQINGEEVLMAAPYFISPKDVRHPSLVFKWFINNSLVSNTNYKKNVLPLRVEAGTSGRAEVRLEIENRDQILQSAKKEISVEF